MGFQTSTIGAVIDALLSTCNTLVPQFNALLPEGSQPVQVFDGIPVDISDTFVVVGGRAEPTAEGTQVWAALGAREEYENYDVDVTVSAYVGGGDAAAISASAGDAQMAARTAAFGIYAVIANQLQTDPTLGGTISQWCLVHHVSLDQTNQDSSDSEHGRRADVRFLVHVYNRLGIT